MKKNILIAGGELRNKGAQAMTFIAASEMRRRFPEYEVVVLSAKDYPPDIVGRIRGQKGRNDYRSYVFDIEFGNSPSVNNLFLGYRRVDIDSLRLLFRKKELRRLKELYKNAALLLDVSGYAFGAQWGYERSKAFLRSILVAERWNIPIYLLPQSFGPFIYSDEAKTKNIASFANKVFSEIRVVFARERQGLSDLQEICPSANIRLSEDLVLQSGELDLGDVFTVKPCLTPFTAHGKTVGIVPNIHNIHNADCGTLEKNMRMYQAVINYLLGLGYEDILLIRHASEDLKQCNEIKALFPTDQRVRVLGEDRYCFEYGEIFAACDFVIASRYHSIVHAYREGVPCIALGWAVKYLELLERCGQDGLAFDVTSPGFNPDDVLAAVDRVIAEHDELSGRIKATVAEARRHNVFDAVEEDFKSLQGGGAR